MKTTIAAAIVIALCSFAFVDVKEEKKAISTTLEYYMEGGKNLDFNMLKKAFHEDAIMTINKGEEGLKQVNAREFFSKMKPGEPLKRTNEIVRIDMEGDTAFARLKLEYDDKIFHDFMTLQKINGTWYIVNKSFYTEKKSM